MKLSAKGQKELKHMQRQVKANPQDEAEPTGRFDNLPASEKEYIIKEYERLGGK